MKVSGFTFIKDAITYDYPIVESIRSILPICDEIVVAVGKSTDDTLDLIRSIDNPKIKIIETVWDETKRKGGRVLSQETDKAFAAISDDSDWAFYIQGDEVVHEQYLDTIRHAMQSQLDRKEVDGLLFKYKHFYGSYDYIGASSNWYQHEIRIVRNDRSIYSYRDAQGFRKADNCKLRVHPIDAYIYHYGWVKEPQAMQKKHINFNKYWHDDQWIEQNIIGTDEFDYNSAINELRAFEGTHPEVMQERISKKNWQFRHDISYSHKSTKDSIKAFLKKYMGINLEYQNYIVVK